MVNYGLPSYKQKQKPAKWLTEPAQKLRVHERSLKNKRKLAEEIDDNAMLITGIRFYTSRLMANRRTAAAPIRAIETKKTGGFGQHLKAVRRLLGISYIKASTLARRKHKPWFVAGDVMAMPGSYRAKLEAIGFNPWSDPDEFADFKRLNPNLELDDDTAAFARRYPILENVKRFLLGQEAVNPKDALTHSKQRGYGGFVGSSLHGTAPSANSPPINQNKIIIDVQKKQALKRAANFTS
jgi:hypothetical protein